MADLAALTADAFDPVVGSPFPVAALDGGAEATLTLHLVEVERHSRPKGDREPFSLVFEGPRTALLPQGLHRLAHGSLGELEIFLVPVGMTEASYRYEAVFG